MSFMSLQVLLTSPKTQLAFSSYFIHLLVEKKFLQGQGKVRKFSSELGEIYIFKESQRKENLLDTYLRWIWRVS